MERYRAQMIRPGICALAEPLSKVALARQGGGWVRAGAPVKTSEHDLTANARMQTLLPCLQGVGFGLQPPKVLSGNCKTVGFCSCRRFRRRMKPFIRILSIRSSSPREAISLSVFSDLRLNRSNPRN
jgi:hypothetical protein